MVIESTQSMLFTGKGQLLSSISFLVIMNRGGGSGYKLANLSRVWWIRGRFCSLLNGRGTTCRLGLAVLEEV